MLLGIAIFFYLSISKPPGGEQKAQTDKFEVLDVIYGFGKTPDKLLNKPHGVAVDRNGNIYVADSGNNRIVAFDSDGDFLFQFGKKGNKPGEFQAPLGVAVDSRNRIYVADRLLQKLCIFNAGGKKLIREVRVMMPLIPVINSNKVYLTTYGPIFIYDLQGERLSRWGNRGRKNGEFDFANGLAVDSKGNVYVSDQNNLRLQALDKDGKVLWAEGKPPKDIWAKTRRFGLPAGLAIDEDDNLYLVDAFHYSIVVLNKKGKQLDELGGTAGNKKGQLYQPAGIAYAGNRIFVVADKYNNRVQILRIPPYRELTLIQEISRSYCFLIALIGALLLILLAVIWLTRRRRQLEESEDQEDSMEHSLS